MQIAMSRIWTKITNSISYDDNHYTKHTTLQVFLSNTNNLHSYMISDIPNNFQTDLFDP